MNTFKDSVIHREPPTTDPPTSRGKSSDISRKVLSLAREIDRLPAGDYSISLTKPASKNQPWSVTISKGEEPVREMTIPNARIVQTHEGRMGQVKEGCKL
jgi:hypothetical protein